jgi:phage anti-repressor protein
MTNLTFNQSLAVSLYQSDEQFPVDFDDAWQWLGYARKDVAKRLLVRFKEGRDFSTSKWKTSTGGRSSELIMISIDCFKSLAMMAETELGDAARMYFLEVERIAKQSVTKSQLQILPITDHQKRISEIRDRKVTIQQDLDDAKQKVLRLESKLHEITEEEIKASEEFLSNHSEVGREYMKCKDFLDVAKPLNPYISAKKQIR